MPFSAQVDGFAKSNLFVFAGFGNEVNTRLKSICNKIFGKINICLYIYKRPLIEGNFNEILLNIYYELFCNLPERHEIKVKIPKSFTFIFPNTDIRYRIINFFYPIPLLVPISSDKSNWQNKPVIVEDLLSGNCSAIIKALEEQLDPSDSRHKPLHNFHINGNNKNLFNYFKHTLIDFPDNTPLIPKKTKQFKQKDKRGWEFIKDASKHGKQKLTLPTDKKQLYRFVYCFLAGIYRFGCSMQQYIHYDITLKNDRYNIFCCTNNKNNSIEIKDHINLFPNDTFR